MGRFAELMQVQPVEEDKDRSEHSANIHLDAAAHNVDGKQHYIYVKQKGLNKHIAGPFKSKEEAEQHPARKWADGVHSV